MKPVLQVPLNENLAEFTRFLWANEIPHRVTEDEQAQTLWVSPTISSERVIELYRYWQQGGELERISVQHKAVSSRFWLVELYKIPVTVSLILLSVIATLVIDFGANSVWLSRLAFSPFEIRGEEIFYSDLSQLLAEGQYWRFISPAFLHFSLLHILFNLLWIWVVGRRIEQLQGSAVLLLLALFSGFSSNIAQYWVSGPLFGGMSGVVFAVLAYTWLWDRLNHPQFLIPPALMGFMLFWLALGYSGALEFMGLGAIANTAHLAGLVSGLVAALIGTQLSRSRRAL